MPLRLTHAVAELQQEVKVLQFPLEMLGIAEGDAKTRPCAGRQPCGALFIPVRKIGRANSNTSSPSTIWLVWGLNIIDCMDRILSADLAISGLLPLHVDVADKSLVRYPKPHHLDTNDLLTTIAKAAHRLDLGGKRLSGAELQPMPIGPRAGRLSDYCAARSAGR
jgi:hypothetical protein